MEQSRVAIVTGSAGGLGAAIGRRLMRDGYRVAGVDLAPTPSDACVAQYRCDLGDPAAIRHVAEAVGDDLGTPALLVNNAGYCGSADFFELSAEQIARTLTINVAGVLLLSQAVARQMREAGRGSIVNMASIAGRRGSSQIEYGASKAAVINLTTTLARTLAPYGIRVNAIAPALVEAGMGVRLSDRVRGAFLAQTPLGRGAHPDEIAGVVAFLASDDASYVTGATIDVHGGL